MLIVFFSTSKSKAFSRKYAMTMMMTNASVIDELKLASVESHHCVRCDSCGYRHFSRSRRAFVI